MSIDSMMSGDAVTELTYVDQSGASMGKGKTWKKGRTLDCHVSMRASATTGAPDLNMKNQVLYGKVYFATDPELKQGQRLLWGDTVLVMEGLPRNPHQMDRFWLVHVTLHVLNNLNPDMVIG